MMGRVAKHERRAWLLNRIVLAVACCSLLACDRSRDSGDTTTQSDSSGNAESNALVKAGDKGVTPECADNDETKKFAVQDSAAARDSTAWQEAGEELEEYVLAVENSIFRQKREKAAGQVGARIEPENERHDCQRIIVTGSSGLRYDGNLTVWAFKGLSDYPYTTRKLVAAMHFDSAAYPNLGIKRGVNCVFLQTNPLKAWVLSLNPGDYCDDSLTGGDPIGVHAYTLDDPLPPDPHSGKRPAVARIVDTGSEYFLGLQCGTEWCVVGGPVNGTKPTLILPNGRGDAQRLGYMVDGKLTPSTLIGAIKPTNALFQYQKKEEYRVQGGRLIATIEFSGTGPSADAARARYATKMGLTGSLPPSIDVRMQYEDGIGYLVFFGNSLLTKLVSPVNLKDHTLKGMMRWRWDPRDEKWWIQCPAGCCTPY